MTINKKQLLDFTDRWSGQGYEKGETQKFWIELLQAIQYPHTKEVKFEHHLSNGGFIDVWLRDASVLIEQKSLSVDLDKLEERQGVLKTPLMQAVDYADDLPRPEQPRYIVTCNFGTFRVYDRDKFSKAELENNCFEFTLQELGKHPEYLSFILDPKNSRLEKEKEVSIQAGTLIGKLYDELKKGYIDPESSDSMHALNVLCVRLVFCLYCEDSDLFPKDAFYNYIHDIPANNLRLHLKRLFEALNTPVSERDQYDTDLKVFPYVNGGLFREEIEIPNFTDDMKEFLVNDISATVNWSHISPTIFGGIFESTLNPETRRSGGMHYTSPKNIHKVIDPLFLDDLYDEFNSICNTEGQTPRALKARLRKFHEKICSLNFLDPACGSGNFLTETYLCLRKLEDDVLNKLHDGQTAMSFSEDNTDEKRVSLSQFYGIEINDFAVTVAETALWISRLKANGDSEMINDTTSQDFPLIDRPNILCANALLVDWNDVISAEKCNYVMGNPPFIGQYLKSDEQTEDLKSVWGKNYDGYLDYVTGWFKKSIDFYSASRGGQFAFVSTNSISQGQPVPALFKPIFEAGWRIKFAHQTFPWTTESTGGAAVHCVITGYDKENTTSPRLFTYPNFKDEPVEVLPKNINAYLLDSPNLFIMKRTDKLLSPELSNVNYGSKAADGNFLIIKSKDIEHIKNDPIANKYLRRFIGARELIHSIDRWCLWMADEDFDPKDLDKSPILRERVNNCRKWRSEQKATGDAYKLKDVPHIFRPNKKRPTVPYICIPSVVSENRDYFTAIHLKPEVIASNAVFCAEDPDGFLFAIISSSMFITWQKAIGGRLKSDLRFSSTLVWNNLPLPAVDDNLRQEIIKAGKGVLEARTLHPERSLAEHYEPGKLSPELQKAHDALDILVDKAFGATAKLNSNEERLNILFERYIELTNSNK